MLILTRKPGESLYIGDTVKVTIVEIKGNQIRVGIDAPTDLRIYREEIYVQILEENRKAAEALTVPESGLEGLSDAWRGRQRSAPEGAADAPGEVAGAAAPRPLLAAGMRTMKRSESSLKNEPLKNGDPQIVVKRRRVKDSNE